MSILVINNCDSVLVVTMGDKLFNCYERLDMKKKNILHVPQFSIKTVLV